MQMHTSYAMNCCQLYWWWNWCNSSIYGPCISQLRNVFFSFFIFLHALYVRMMINMNRLFDLQVTLQCSIPRSLCAYAVRQQHANDCTEFCFTVFFFFVSYEKNYQRHYCFFFFFGLSATFWLWKQVEWCKSFFFSAKAVKENIFIRAIRGNFNLFPWNLCLWPINDAERQTNKQMQWAIAM